MRYPNHPGHTGNEPDTKDTSQAAANHVAEKSLGQRHEIIEILTNQGQLAMWQIHDAMQNPSNTNLTSARLAELRASGTIRTTGETRRSPHTGRLQVVVEIAPPPFTLEFSQ